MRVDIKPVDHVDLHGSKRFRRDYGFMTNDSLVLAVMKRHKVIHLTSLNAGGGVEERELCLKSSVQFMKAVAWSALSGNLKGLPQERLTVLIVPMRAGADVAVVEGGTQGLHQQLRNFEVRYSLKTPEFYARFLRGEMGDSRD